MEGPSLGGGLRCLGDPGLGQTVDGGSGGIDLDVCTRTSSFEITASGPKGASPAPLNLPLTFILMKVFSKAAQNAGKESSLVMFVTLARARHKISPPNGPKRPTSSG